MAAWDEDEDKKARVGNRKEGVNLIRTQKRRHYNNPTLGAEWGWVWQDWVV